MEILEKGIQGIKFLVTLEGNGIVNYDDISQKFFLNKHCGTNLKNDNLKLSKKTFYKLYDSDSDYEKAVAEYAMQNDIEPERARYYVPQYGFHLKISSECLRNAIFKGASDSDSTIWEHPALTAKVISNPKMFNRGYMNPNPKNQFTKKSTLTVCDAIDTDAIIVPEIHTKSGKRDDNSLWYSESVGKTKFVFEAIFDVETAQFLSADEYFGRIGIPEDLIEGENLLEKEFKNRYGRIPYTLDVYSKNSDIFGNSFGERGLLFDDEFVNEQIKEIIKYLLEISIKRAGGEVHTKEIKYKPIYSALDNIKNSVWDDGWINITSCDEFKPFKIHHYYKKAIHSEWEDRRNIEVRTKKTKSKKETNNE